MQFSKQNSLGNEKKKNSDGNSLQVQVMANPRLTFSQGGVTVL